VLRVIPKKNKVVVQGHNIAKKHVRPSRRNPQGGRVNVEQPIHVSNVLPLSTEGGKGSKGSKVGYQVNEDGSKERILKRGGKKETVKRTKE
jgi:large subunit ribosomal protein L24